MKARDLEIERLRQERDQALRDLAEARARLAQLQRAGQATRDIAFVRYEALPSDVRVAADALGALCACARMPGLVRAHAALPLVQFGEAAAVREAAELGDLAAAYPVGATERQVIARGDVVRATTLLWRQLALSIATCRARVDDLYRREAKRAEKTNAAAASPRRQR